jgi:segregation and condensation protein B
MPDETSEHPEPSTSEPASGEAGAAESAMPEEETHAESEPPTPLEEESSAQAVHGETAKPEAEGAPASPSSTDVSEVVDLEATINLSGDSPFFQQLQDRLAQPAPTSDVTRSHLKGLLEALIFASDHPQKANDLAKAASANVKEVRDLLDDLKTEYRPRGIQLDEVAGGWIFRTSSAYAPFVRDLTKQKPVRLSRAQVETLAILAYRQPVTRPEIDDIRGVDSGPVLKVLLERDLVRILGKKDEPGRPMIYGTTTTFLEFFGLKSLKDLPTLREFTELNEDSRRVAEKELGEVLDEKQPEVAATGEAAVAAVEGDVVEVERDGEEEVGEGAIEGQDEALDEQEPGAENDRGDEEHVHDGGDGLGEEDEAPPPSGSKPTMG